VGPPRGIAGAASRDPADGRALRHPACLVCAVLAAIFAAVACATATTSSTSVRFDSGRAFEHIRRLVSFGPRPPGSPGSAEARRYIKAQLEAAGLVPVEQSFTASTPLGPMTMVNVSAVIPGARRDRVIFGGHYDTKLFREFRFVGANDGGSSSAMLLELARVLKNRKNAFTIELVFFDGEEALVDWNGNDHTYGSRMYVEAAAKSGTLASLRALILVDMVADRQLTIRREAQSTPWLTDLIWAAAARVGHRQHFLDESAVIHDDHVPFLEADIPAVDIIDLEPSYARPGRPEPGSDTPWHTSADTLDAVAARSMQVVGEVLLDALPRIEAELRRR
jgi:glutaminyl-peptide cyclotransferase